MVASSEKSIAVKLDRKEKARYEKALGFVKKVKLFSRAVGDVRIFKSFMEIVHAYNEGFIEDKKIVLKKGKKIFADRPDLLREFEAFFLESSDHQAISNPKPNPNPNNDRAVSKRKKNDGEDEDVIRVSKKLDSAKEIDPRTLTCTPSYRLLKKACGPSKVAGSLESEVLNGLCVIAIPEADSDQRAMSEDECEMIKFEDDLYEVDMHFHRTKSALENAEKLRDLLEKNPDFEVPIRVEDHLTDFDLKCIKSLYVMYGQTLIELIRTNPRKALPVLLLGLNQRKDYCQDFRTNYLKLEHRS